MPNNSRSLRKRCLGYISALATPFMGVRVMWVHLLLSILLPLCPGWVDYLLNIDALYRIPMMVNIITTERHLPFNLTACTLTLILVPGYAIYAAMKFKTAGTNVDWLGVRPGTKHRLRTIIQLLLMVPLVSLTMWEMWGTTLPAQDYLVPGHLASPAGMMLLVIMPLYGIAAILPHMLTMFAASLRPTAAVTGNGNSDAAKEPAVVPRQNKAKKARRRSTSARKAARH